MKDKGNVRTPQPAPETRSESQREGVRAAATPATKALSTIMAAATISFVLSACGVGEAAIVADEAAPQVPAIPVAVTDVTRGSVEATYSVTAVLEAKVEARLTARVSGDVLEILVEEGEMVTAGQVMARLDTRRIELQVRQAQSTVDRLSNELERSHALHQTSSISDEAYDRLRYDLEASRAELQTVLLDRSYADIRAPIAGVVSQRLVKLGNHLSTGDHAFTVTQLDAIEAQVQVPQAHQGLVVSGQTVRMTFDALPGQVFDGLVDRVNPVIDPQTGTFKVTVAPSGESAMLMPGMFGRIEIVHDQHDDALLIPVDALRREDDQQLLYVVADGVAHRRDVSVGYSRDGMVEVLEGIAEGESIVVLGQEHINEGTVVATVRRAGP
jgi:membrane fusion protein, multidrug efflux system